MRRYYNLSYLFRPKRLFLLPEYFKHCIFNNRVQIDSFKKACSYRSSLMCCNFKLEGKSRTVSEMVSIENMRPISGNVLQKISECFKVQSALEPGTCFGVGTMFMATSTSGKVGDRRLQ